MRNLKRVLSLTLASVMLMGMMVVGSSAAKGYDDVSETDNVEAIEVLQEIEVMVGDDRGFGPERPVNRAEMAVVMGKLLSLDYNYYTALCPFTDVYDWAQGWVGACYANKIVSGRGDGIYDPGATVTAVEAASMLMRALGYFQYQNDYSDGFELATVTQGKKIGIFDNVGSSASEPMTRNQVAQMVLNALQSAVVEPDGNTINLTTPDGTVLTGKVNYVSVTSKKPYASAISRTEATSIGSNNDGYIVELGERLYDGKLKLIDARDDFGRPSRLWEFDGKEIGTYAKKENIRETYHVEVTGKDLYDLIGKATLDDTANWDVNIYVDGISTDDENAAAWLDGTDNAFKGYFIRADLARNNKTGVGATGKGVTTQVFVDSDKKDVDIVVVNTYLAKAQSDYKEKTDDATLKVYKIKNRTNNSNPVYVKFNTLNDVDVSDEENMKVLGEDFSIVKDIQKDDFYLVTVAGGVIQTIAKPEIVSDTTLNAFKKTSWVNADGTQYDYASTAEYDVEVLDRYTSIDGKENLKDRQYNIILDKYGYMVGLELVEDVKNYAFVTGIDADTSNLKNKTADVNLIFLDGTSDVVKVNMDKSTSAPYISAYDKTADYSSGALLDRKIVHQTDTTNGNEDDVLNTVDNTYRNQTAGELALMNTWVTYTVNTNGVYTLSEVAARIDSGDMNKSGTKIKVAQYHDDVNGDKINTKNPYLTGGDAKYNKVYGNNDTVYLTAKLDYVRYDGTNYAAVITGAENVITNVDNADLTIEDSTTVGNKTKFNGSNGVNTRYNAGGVYTLYNSDGYVIAAMVVGRDNGSSNRLVYVHTSDVEQERYDAKTGRASSDGDWTWVRKVIYQGEEISLTESGDSLNYISPDPNHGNMKKGEVYKISYNANGEVIAAANAFKTGGSDTATGDNSDAEMVVGPGQTDDLTPAGAYEAIHRAVDINPSLKEYDNIVFQRNYTGVHANDDVSTYVDRPTLKGDTLYVETENNTGVRVASDVKTVLIQTNGGKEYTYWNEGSGSLRSIIDDLNKTENLDHDFQLTLFIEKSAVRYAVIRDDIKDGYQRPGTGSSYTVTAPASLLLALSPDGPWTSSLTGVTAADKIYVKAADGATVNSVKLKGNSLTLADGLWSFNMSDYNASLKATDFTTSSKIGGKLTTKIEALDIEWTGTVSNGSTYVTLTLNKWPDWAPKTAAITVAGDISATIEGAAIGTAKTVTFTYADKNTEGKWVVSGIEIDRVIDGTNIVLGEVSGDEFIPSAVNVEYYDGKNNRVEGRLKAGYTATLPTNRSADNPINFQISETASGQNFKYSLTGTNHNFTDEKTSSSNDSDAQKISDTSGTIGTSTVTDDLYAIGDSVVTVTIKGLEDVAETYTISTDTAALFHSTVGSGSAINSNHKKTDGTANTATDHVIISLTGATVTNAGSDTTTTAMTKGTSVRFGVEVDDVGSTDTKAVAYKITVTIDGNDYSVTVDGTTKTGVLTTMEITKNIVINKTDVVVDPIYANKVASVTADTTGKVITVTFDRELKEDTAIAANFDIATGIDLDTSKGTSGVSVSGKTVTFYLLNPVTVDGKTIKVKADVMDSDGRACDITEWAKASVDADGKTTWDHANS